MTATDDELDLAGFRAWILASRLIATALQEETGE